MKTVLKTGAALAGLLLMGACAADTGWAGMGPLINGVPAQATEIARVENRLQAGVRAGSISPAEAAELRAELRLIRDRRGALSVGGMTPAERAEIDGLLDALSARIAVLEQNYAFVAPPADAFATRTDQWTAINSRQQWLRRQIDDGVRSGRLTAQEADRLWAEYEAVADLESFYRPGGISASERADLDLRFDRLAVRLANDRADWQRRNWFGGEDWTDSRGGWVSIDRRQVALERRIEEGMRTGKLTAAGAGSLMREFHNLALVEESYRVGGLTGRERAYLDNSFDALAARITEESRDQQARYP